MHSKILRAMVVATLAAAPLAAQAGIFTDTAPGAQKGDWIVRAGVTQVNPKPENLSLGDDSYLVVDSDVSFTFDVTYMFMEHFGVELLGAYPFKHGIDAKAPGVSDVRVADTEHLPPTLSVVWRPMAYESTFQPYVGVGMNYTFFFNEQVRKGWAESQDLPRSTELSLDNSFGVAGVVGLDVFPWDKKDWFVNGNVRWIDISSDASLKVPTNTTPGSRTWAKVELGDVDISPWVYTLNIGKRFGAPKPEPVAAPLPPPPPPPPPPPAKCADSDNDGVCDEADKCPNTPAGTTVDKYGCPCAQELKVLFDFDSAELRPESITELERVVKFMNDVPIATVQIDGHTDSVGTEEYNMKLSDRRAKAVFDYLSSRGVDPARMASKGFGESQPIAPNDTAEGRQLNRRVMLIRTDSCAK
jgi:outer membrane protein OmpA-like peptidoglycan-associated protein/outer membrane protein W